MTMRFDRGGVTIHRLVESESPVEMRHAQDFHPNLTAERLAENRGWMRPSMLDEADRIILCFQSHVVRTPHHVVLVDACLGNGKDRPAHPDWHRKSDNHWMHALAQAGLTVEDIDIVCCTHLHVDHVGWNTRLLDGRWVPTFPRARYLFSAKELAFWQARQATDPLPWITDSVLPVVEAGRVDLVASDHAVDDHLRLLPTPGHTIDHFAVEMGRGRADAVITGDLVHTPLQARYPDLTMRLDHDAAQAVATRRAFFERVCETDTLCCFAHFPSPSTGLVRRWGDGFRCEGIGPG
jgi:glyoxylase-like metal-dependent hydrolase (beta-lactamase superfamily II)